MSLTLLSAHAENFVLNYNRPSIRWTEALPLGNGNLGAMVFGGVKEARFQLNEDTLYIGEPYDYSRPDAHQHLEKLRSLLLEGQQHNATHLAQTHMMSNPISQIPYQALGDIKLLFPDHDGHKNYQRTLDIKDAKTVTSYTVDDIQYKRTAFASYPDKVIVIKIEADRKGKVNFTAQLSAAHKDHTVVAADNTITVAGHLPKSYSHRGVRNFENPLRFHSVLQAKADGGSVTASDGQLHIAGANSATLIFTADSSHVNFRDVSGDPKASCDERLDAIADQDWETLYQTHRADYQELFNRVSIDLGSSARDNMPTFERLKLATQKDEDPGLAALLYQYGRYLMISCSRPGTQPSNLQGIWNDRNDPPWGSRYTVNINTEMNYWPAEMTNLSECHEPLFDALEELAISGAVTAKNHYNCGGWVLHHNFDLWRGTAPINAANHGVWTTGGAWLCQHLWWHYEYNQDRDFLARAYPIMKGAAEFFVDFLIEDPRNDKGWLIAIPSHSPENGGMVAGATMDHQIIRDLFQNVIAASEVLERDPEFRSQLQAMSPKIAPNQIGQHGQLQEWLEDIDDPKNKHRHVSHLWGLHPGSEINWQDTPELFEAAKQSLEFRGDGATGWSMGWKVNFWARFLDGERAKKLYDNFTNLSGGGLYPNLFCAHPPFQIDGNFGVTAGITEMVMQNHLRAADGSRLLHFLPALPSQWHTGSLTGIRARGNITVDVYWENSQVSKIVLTSKKDQNIAVKIGDNTQSVSLKAGVTTTL